MPRRAGHERERRECKPPAYRLTFRSHPVLDFFKIPAALALMLDRNAAHVKPTVVLGTSVAGHEEDAGPSTFLLPLFYREAGDHRAPEAQVGHSAIATSPAAERTSVRVGARRLVWHVLDSCGRRLLPVSSTSTV